MGSGLVAATIFGCLAQGRAAPGEGAAAVVMYHRFGEDQFPSTSIRLDQFEAHLAELGSGDYNVLPLPELISILREGRPLPPRSVAITIDDAYLSVYREAWPRLRAAALPFTLFVSTQPLDAGLPAYLSWDQLREMAAAGGMTVGHHGHEHSHMIGQTAEENRQNIAKATARFEAELGQRPAIFAYPYGEYGLQERNLVETAGFIAAFGQHSGASGPHSDLYALPRYPFSETYGDMSRFKLAVNSLPLPVQDVLPLDPHLKGSASNPPNFGFTVSQSVTNLSQLNCFASNNTVTLANLGGGRIEVRLAQPLRQGRSRINCTLPADEGRWRWYGVQFYVGE